MLLLLAMITSRQVHQWSDGNHVECNDRDACDYSPAAAEKAVTVGASTLGDERAYFSNFGICVRQPNQ